MSNSGLSNVTIADLVTLLHPATPAMPPYPYMQPQPQPPPLTIPVSDMLLPSLHSIGLAMPLTAFCSQYNITGAVHEKLANEGYTDSPLLQYVSIAKLKKAGFKNGEIASLKYAMAKWSVPNV